MQHKIGIYVRVSTEEQSQIADGSLESQQHRVRSFVEVKNLQEKNWGKIVETYIDDGYSAKNTNRPAYQRMLKDIRSGRISLILITDLSRLSRSISDFCVLLKDLEKYKAKFLSIKEQFDTSTPAGEMMIFNMINLAQFERRQTSERISLNFHSRAMRGLVNGGSPILGFDKDPTNPGRLVVNEDEAKMIRYIFDLYLEVGSLSQTTKRLNDEKINRKANEKQTARHVAAGRWTVVAVQRLLKNFAYVGMREVNKGNIDEQASSLKAWQQYQLVKASWPAIVDKKVFDQVQKAIEQAKESERKRISGSENRVFLASGFLRCGHCHRALFGQSAHGRNQVHRYYAHKTSIGEKLDCPIRRIPADEVENAIIQYLDQVILSVGHLDKVETNIEKSLGVNQSASVAKKEQVERSISKITGEIDSVFRILSSFTDGSAGGDLVRERLQTLAVKKRDLEKELEDLVHNGSFCVDTKEVIKVIEERVLEFKRGWKKATAILQKRLLRKIFHQLFLTECGLDVYYPLGEDSKDCGNDSKTKRPSGVNPDGLLFPFRRPAVGLPFAGSSIVTVGGPDRDRTCDALTASQVLYQLSYRPT